MACSFEKYIVVCMTGVPWSHDWPMWLSLLMRGHVLKLRDGGTWVAQSVKHLTSAQVMISQFVSSSPVSGSVLTAQSLDPTSDSVSPSLSASLLFMLSLSKINIKKFKKIQLR